jgi:hypothetical protein
MLYARVPLILRQDLDRSEELGRNIVAGAPNCRLVGGRWRYIPRPVEGDSIYTDCEHQDSDV